MGLFNKDNQHKGGGLKRVFEMSKSALNLSAEQEKQVKQIFRNLREERREVKSEGSENMRDEMRTARQEAKQKLMAVLNDEQKNVFEENFKKWKDQADRV